MTFDEAKEVLGGELEPTPEEAKNGWTTEGLTIYHAERAQVAADELINPRATKPMRTRNAMRWL